jgi:hypothetical protein
MAKKYWSQRKGLTAKFDLPTLKIAIKSIYYDFLDKNYFQEYYGYHCVDAGYVYGKAGLDVPNFIFRKIRREIKWPLEFDTFDEDTLFDMIELLHDTISFPLEGYFHEYAGCGYHYSTFDTLKGQEEYRKEVNEIIADYESGYVLNSDGIIQYLLTPGLNELTMANIPSETGEENKIDNKIERAIAKYRDRHSTIADRREAIRELADVLEYLKSTLDDNMTTDDEKELVKIQKNLFNIANNFLIRHNNDTQKDNYNPLWMSWIFYLYLSSIHLLLRIRKEDKTQIS